MLTHLTMAKITEIFETPKLQDLMQWTSEQLMAELQKRAEPIRIEHNLTEKQMNSLVQTAFQSVQNIRNRIH